MSYSTSLAQKIVNFQRFIITSNFGESGEDGRHHRPPAALQPIICTSSCRAHDRLSINLLIFKML